MKTRVRFARLFGYALIFCLGAAALADKLILKDGTTVEGTVMKQGESYWIREASGQSRLIPESEVKSHVTGAAAASGTVSGGDDFNAAKRRADAMDAPLAAIAIWEKYLESKPPAGDEKLAREELEKWKKLHDDGAEKINGKWVGGQERKEIVKKANTLLGEAIAIYKDQALAAITKLEQAVRIYPNSQPINFSLGYLHARAKNFDLSAKYFELTLRLDPNAPDALNNYGVALVLKKDYARGLDMLLKAARIQDTPALAQNMVNAMAAAPPAIARSKKLVEAANLLASKYHIGAPTPGFVLIAPSEKQVARAPDRDLPPGVRGSGTGFIIRDDGLILTNRHVVDGATSLLVLLPGNVRKPADVVKIDEDQDLALIRVRTDQKLAVARFSPTDSPSEGLPCYALGYPMVTVMGTSIKITQGIVSGLSPRAPADIVTDAKVNPGNSGGPLVDGRGLVLGIVSMKSIATDTEDSYGMAISAGRIRKFLAENKIVVTAGSNDEPTLAPDQIAAKLKPATVCILAIR